MTDDHMRSDMEALMTRLVQTERALMDTRQQIAAVPKAAAPLVDTRTIGKALAFIGHFSSLRTWDLRILRRLKHCVGRWQDHSRSGRATEF